MELAVFTFFAILALASAVVVILHRNPVYSTVALVLTLISTAALFVQLGAPFIATLQVLVYTGAIVVLFLFVLMLLNVGREEAQAADGHDKQRWGAVIGAGIFAGTVGATLWRAFQGLSLEPLTRESVDLKLIARALFSKYLLGFEIVGLLLLVAVVAATVLARKLPASPGEQEDAR